MKEDLAAVILTGGRSSRMGTDKAFLPMPGSSNTTFLSHILSLLQRFACIALSVAAENERYAPFGCIQIADRWPGIGPMGGIASALSVLEANAVLVLACDTPLLSSALIDQLAEAYSAHPDADCICCTDPEGRLQPLCAIYNKKSLPHLLNAIAQKRYALHHVINELETVRLTLDKTLAAQASANINTPEEYAAIIKKRGC